MPRLMSVAYTEDAVRAEIKTVSRRAGWVFLAPGDVLDLCRKVMGRRRGEPLIRLKRVRVIDVRRESLWLLATLPATDYARTEMELEGFPGMDPGGFVLRYFTAAQGIRPDAEITRVEWEYLPTPPEWPALTAPVQP